MRVKNPAFISTVLALLTVQASLLEILFCRPHKFIQILFYDC